MAQHAQNKEFDRLYGAVNGRKFRTGQSSQLDITRTMEETRNFLNPHLKNVAKRQYSN